MASTLLGPMFCFLIFCAAVAQEAQTLPPACMLQPSSPSPAHTSLPAFQVPLTNGSVFLYSASSKDSHILPLVSIVVDFSDDLGGILAVSDSISIDNFLLDGPPARGNFMFVALQDGTIEIIEEGIRKRLSYLNFTAAKAAEWLSKMLFVASTAASITPLQPFLTSWPSPRLSINISLPSAIQSSRSAESSIAIIPRIDGANECFMQPMSVDEEQLAGEALLGCDPNVHNISGAANKFVLVKTTDTCEPDMAISWTKGVAALAKGVILGVARPVMIGRNCTDVFYDDPFIPSAIGMEDFDNLAKALSSKMPLNFTFDYSCDTSYGFVANHAGVVEHLGWRKVNTLMFFEWERTMYHYISTVEDAVSMSSAISILPANTTINPAAVVNISISRSKLQSFANALFEFQLTCPSLDETFCGPWDRIITATAQCRDDQGTSTQVIEVARWITPFRRGVGRWLSPAHAFLALVGNSSLESSSTSTCTITVDVCCELWTAQLDLHLFAQSTDAVKTLVGSEIIGIPFQVTPVVYPNTQTTFNSNYDSNRSTVIITPPGVSRVYLFSYISGHGANPPPPVDVGCEYAPTSHAWAINGQGMLEMYNTSLVAYEQFMLAGTPSGCQDKLSRGVIANQHGDYPDGRNGWCPGQGVTPIVLDVTMSWDVRPYASNTISYFALSYYVGHAPDWVPYNASTEGCGGDVFMSTNVLFV